MDDRKQVGELGEKKALKYLKENGYKIMQRNFKCRTGEVDIIAMDGKTIVFIEVKTRRSLSYGLPCESVTAAKKKHILRTTRYYVSVNKLEDHDQRIDVIEVYLSEGGTYYRHIKNAI